MADSKVTALTEISIPALEDLMYWVDDPGGTPASNKITAARLLGLMPGVPQARLGTETGVGLSTTDQLAKGTLYYVPCLPNGMATGGVGFTTTWDGTRRKRQQIGEVNLALTLTSGKNYDVFQKNSDLSLVLSAAWTNDTTRADALTTAGGLIVANADNTYLWLGTIRASATDKVADSGGLAGTTQVGATRFVWNAYNQIFRPMKVIDTTDSWSYTTATVRQANAAAGNKVEWVTGFAGTLLRATVNANAVIAGSSTTVANSGVGIDATNAFSGLVGSAYSSGAVTIQVSNMIGNYSGYPGLGYHYAAWCEKGADVSCSFTGDNIGDGTQSGLDAELLC